MRYVLTTLMLLACLLASGPAAAQFVADDSRPEFITVSTSTTSAVAVGIIMLTVVNVRKDPTAMNRYLRQNEPAVRSALALGGGAVIEDLAAFFEVEPHDIPRFASVLRRHRVTLTAAAFDDTDRRGFATVLRTALLFDRMR